VSRRRRHRVAPATEQELQVERDDTRAADLRWAMDDPRGRRLLRELLYDPDRGLGLDTMPPAGLPDGVLHGEAAKRARAKDVDDRLQRELPELWLAMHQEHLEDRLEEKNLRATADAEHPPDEGDEP
jgi:hypothetical protein